jgi:hypothetical protein
MSKSAYTTPDMRANCSLFRRQRGRVWPPSSRRLAEGLASPLGMLQRDLLVSKVDTKMLASGPILSAIAPVILSAWGAIPK